MIINDLDYMEDAFYGISGGKSVRISLNAGASDTSADIGGYASASGKGYTSSSIYGNAYTTDRQYAYYKSYSYISGSSYTPGARADGNLRAYVYND